MIGVEYMQVLFYLLFSWYLIKDAMLILHVF